MARILILAGMIGVVVGGLMAYHGCEALKQNQPSDTGKGIGLFFLSGIVLFLGINLRARSSERQVVTCASCGWIGSRAKHQESGGCPRCGSDATISS